MKVLARGRAGPWLVMVIVVTVGRPACREQVVMGSPREVFFDSSGVRCAADLYLPDDVSVTAPGVVMGHGGSGTKRLGLPAYAKKFAGGGIAAVVSQVPMIDGMHRGRSLRQRLSWEVSARTLQFTVAALRDRRRARRGESPYLVPVVAPTGQVAVFTEPDAAATFEALGGEACGWRNELALRFIFQLPRYARGTAERLAMPLLMVLADRDLQASSTFAARIAARAPYADIRHYPLGHFDVYLGDVREEISDRELAFLRAHLMVGTSPAGATALSR